MSEDKRKGAVGAGSLFAPINVKKCHQRTKDRAENLCEFIKFNPNCTRKDMVKIVRWANKDNVRKPLRILMTQKRIWIDTTVYPWQFSLRTSSGDMNPVAWSYKMEEEGKIEQRKCQGIKKDGTDCRVPSLFVGEDGYCKYHRNQKLNDSMNKVQQLKQMRKEILQNPENRWQPPYDREQKYPYHPLSERQPFDRIVGGTTHVGNAEGVKTIVIHPDETVVVKVKQLDANDEYKSLILKFLAGEATIQDLKKAVLD